MTPKDLKTSGCGSKPMGSHFGVAPRDVWGVAGILTHGHLRFPVYRGDPPLFSPRPKLIGGGLSIAPSVPDRREKIRGARVKVHPPPMSHEQLAKWLWVQTRHLDPHTTHSRRNHHLVADPCFKL